jgi:uncharacterized membrane protein
MNALTPTSWAPDLSVDPYWPVLVVLGIALLGWLLVRGSYRWGGQQLPPRFARWSPVLRYVVLALVALCLLRPSAVLRQVLREQGQLLVLVDASASMGIADEPGGRSRAQSLAQAFADAEDDYGLLRSVYQVKQFEFAETLHPVEELTFAAEGGRTALGDALSQLLRGSLPSRLAGVLLATDGASNTGPPPEDVAQVYRKLHLPLYIVACGEERAGRGSRDVAVEHLDAPKAVYVRNVAAITASVSLLGVAQEPVAVRLLVDDGEVDRRTIASRTGEEPLTVRFRYLPTEPGYHKVTVEAVPVPNERTTANNRVSAYLNVLSGKLAVLYLEGAVRWEFKFLRRALEEAREVDLTARILLAPGGREGASALLPDERWDQFDVVILGDLARNRLTTAQLEALAKAVAEGTGLIALGGYDTYGSAFFQTPLEPLFPLYLEAVTFQREGTYRVHPAAHTEGHPAVSLSPVGAESAALWGSLPELVGGVKPTRLKPAATPLLEDPAGAPVLVVQPYGRGRVAALLADTTWRWAVAGEKERELHRRFWRQLVLWTAGREELRRENLWVELAQTRYLPKEPITPAFHLEDVTGRPLGDATVTASVRPAAGGLAQELRLYRTGDHWESFLTPTEEGDYAIEAKAVLTGATTPPVTATARFVVERTNLELADPLAHIGVLAQMAQTTGGTLLRPDGLGPLLEKLVSQHHQVELERVSRRDLWNRPELLLLIVGLLTADWVLRRRSGLV